MNFKKLALSCVISSALILIQTEGFASRQHYMGDEGSHYEFFGTQGKHGDPYHPSQGFADQDYDDVMKAVPGGGGLNAVAKRADVPVEQARIIIVAAQLQMQKEADGMIKAKKK